MRVQTHTLNILNHEPSKTGKLYDIFLLYGLFSYNHYIYYVLQISNKFPFFKGLLQYLIESNINNRYNNQPNYSKKYHFRTNHPIDLIVNPSQSFNILSSCAQNIRLLIKPIQLSFQIFAIIQIREVMQLHNLYPSFKLYSK